MELIRFGNFPDRTLGRLTYEDKQWWTIERPWLNNQPNISCVPCGVYPMRRFYDVHGYRSSKNITDDYVWEICEVPDRTVILVHVANRSYNVEGCVGLGIGLYEDLAGVANSRQAITEFYKATMTKKELTITISEGAVK